MKKYLSSFLNFIDTFLLFYEKNKFIKKIQKYKLIEYKYIFILLLQILKEISDFFTFISLNKSYIRIKKI